MCGRGIDAGAHRGIDGGLVTLYRSPDGTRGEFRGLQTCGSPWHCPMCAPKIAAKQVEQMNLSLHRWFTLDSLATADGDRVPTGSVYLLTYTNQHDRDHAGQGECKPRLDRLATALRHFKSRRSYQKLMKALESPGQIRALETTYGELNGWHHHTHEITFAASGALVYDRKGKPVRWLSPLWKFCRPWARTLIRFDLAGLKPGDVGADKFRKLRHLLTHCFDAAPGNYAAEYVAKFGKESESERGRWGLASELAKSHLKTGARRDAPARCEHASPWALLNDSLDGDVRSGELWREFALAFQRRAKLYWSPGLKALFGVPDLADIVIARAPDSRCTVPVIGLSPLQWRVVIAHDAVFDVKRVGVLYGRQAVLDLLAFLEKLKPKFSGEFTIVAGGVPPPWAAGYLTPDGQAHRFWGRPVHEACP
jgi:hypothetical protein